MKVLNERTLQQLATIFYLWVVWSPLVVERQYCFDLEQHMHSEHIGGGAVRSGPVQACCGILSCCFGHLLSFNTYNRK